MKTIACILALAVTSALAELKVGDFKTLQHDVSGSVFAKDDKTIVIYNFNYDGRGPDAFFWIGKEGSPKNTDESSTYILSEGQNYEYRDNAAPVLGAYKDQTITLTLPEGWKMSDVKWISVWCRKFSVDFGNLIVEDGFKAPVEGEPGSPAAEPEPELKPEEPLPDVEGNDVYAEPEAEPSSKAEPEPEPGMASTLTLAPALIFALAALNL
eukprot:TRINITY_DN2145_c0_g1_i7.p1 TRINITY_DN2145_c0_g1~~TRINITY_DN2145_c0_g1_i7.p1  ORF type:complete len:224 (+),score=65.17 TRINITY_DN2145_c0_g1_i7:42-674(+)